MDRWASFRRAVSSICEHDREHKPRTWLVVNEYSDAHRADWTRLMRETFPWMVFVQKPKHLKGQAHSLNLILAAVSHYDHWVQWEDTWLAERPFLARALDVMGNSSISQLQVTHTGVGPSWLDVHSDRLSMRQTPNGTSYVEVALGGASEWPLFSLQPSVNRVQHVLRVGRFNDDPALWPVMFELDFAHRWCKAGCTKAALPDGPVVRPVHVSTHGHHP